MATKTIFGINIAGDKHEFDPDRWGRPKMNGTGAMKTDGDVNGAATHAELPNLHPATGINVLIVGAGMGGLMAALECWRKGHNVVGILERSDGPIYSGIYISA